MADLNLNEEQIDQLVASNRLSPKTAETLRSRALASVPAEEGGILKSAGKAIGEFATIASDTAKEGLDNAFGKPIEMVRNAKSQFDAGVSEGLSGVPVKSDRTMAASAPEKIDLSELAVAPSAPVVQQKPYNPMGDSGLGGAFRMQQEGVQGMADAQSRGLQDQSTLLSQAAEASKAYDQQIANLAEERKLRSQEHQKNLETAQRELEKMHEVNPNRYWENKSTGAKISASIGLFLGAIGGALTGDNQNPALTIIQGAIDKDIEAQRDAYQRLKGKVADKQSAYSLAMNELGNEQAAILAAKASGLQVAELQLKSIASRAQSEEVKAKAKIGLGGIAEEKAKIGLALQQQIEKSTASRQALVGEGVEDPAVLPEEIQKRVVKMPNGLYKPAISEAGAKIVNELSIASQGMRSILRQMRELNSPALPFDQKLALADALKTEYILQKKTAEQLGVLSQVDKEMVESTLGNPGGWRPGKTEALIDMAEKNLEQKYNATLQTYVPGWKPLVKRPAR